MQIIEPLMTLEARISKVTPDKLTVDLGNDFTGIISKNDVALKSGDKNTAGFKIGDTVRAVVISEKNGIVKMSIRKLRQQQRDLEAINAEKAEAEARALFILQEEKLRQAEKKRRDIEAQRVKAALWLHEEKQRRRKEKKTHFKRYGAIAALGIAATFIFILLTANMNNDYDTKKNDVSDSFAARLKAEGIKVEIYDIDDVAGYRPFAPWENRTVRVYRNTDTENADSSNDFVAYLKSIGAKIKVNYNKHESVDRKPAL